MINVQASLPKKLPTSHKGKNGRVLIVAGSKHYYGAPLFNALAAEVAGADLITLYLPEAHAENAKRYSLNFFLKPFVDYDLGLKDIGLINRDTKQNDVLLIGSGIGDDRDTRRAVCQILAATTIPVVLDAEALSPEILAIVTTHKKIITPHHGEFYRLFGVEANELNAIAKAQEYNVIVVLKGKDDIITDGQNTFVNTTGTSKMRVGGTGDALAGLIAGFISQEVSTFDACKLATYSLGLAGESLGEQMHAFTALDLIKYYSHGVMQLAARTSQLYLP